MFLAVVGLGLLVEAVAAVIGAAADAVWFVVEGAEAWVAGSF